MFPLVKALEKFIAFPAAANENVLVFEHRLDDAQNWFWPQLIGAVETVHGLENFLLRRAGIFERALLKAVRLNEVSLVLFHEPAVELGLLVKLRARIRRGERNLQREHVQLLRKIDRPLNRLLGLDRQAENKCAMNHHVRLVAGLG